MPTIADVMDRVCADLAKAEQREVRAREALEAAAAERSRLTNFLAVLAEYGDLPAEKRAAAAPRAARLSKQGTAAVEAISSRRQPMLVHQLGDAIEAAGVEIGGGPKRNSYLASYLSKDPRLKFIRGRGWWVPDLGAVPDGTTHDPSENTEPPDDESSEGSRVAGIQVNGPADREAGTPLLEPPVYRMGGGGTCN